MKYRNIFYSSIALAITLLFSAILYYLTASAPLKYKATQAFIDKLEFQPATKVGEVDKYNVYVIYEGKQYTLENVTTPTKYILGIYTEVFVADGKLYANVEGIRSTSNMANYYFMSLGLCFIAMVNLVFQIQVNRRKSKNISNFV